MEECRKQPRQRALLNGRIACNNQSTMDGTLRNISEDGALIVFSDPTVTPADVILTVPSRREMRRARVAWSRNDRAGLALEPADSARVPLMHNNA